MNDTTPNWLKEGTTPEWSGSPSPRAPERISNASATQQQQKKKWSFREMLTRDGRLVGITIVLIIIMNIPYVSWALYPFSIFSTWIHETCHGIAALMVGGQIQKLEIYPDTSGLAFTIIPSSRRGFVATAGYQGTAVVGMLLLLFRRTKRGPRGGMAFLSFIMLLTVALWIRNIFGIVAMIVLSVSLGACAWKLPSTPKNYVYSCLAVMCTLNTITSVKGLFGSEQYVNGQPAGSTDAHAMAEAVGGTYWMWAIIWLLWALIMTVIGLLFAIPGPNEEALFGCCGACVERGCCNYLNKTDSQKQEANGPTISANVY